MKSYIVTTGAAFGFLFLAHVARVIDEGTQLLGQPVFLLTTIGSLGVCAWAIALLTKLRLRPRT